MVGTKHEAAVGYCRELIVRGQMSPNALREVGARLSVTPAGMRFAHQEAARSLRLDTGGLLERQEASIAWVRRQREAALSSYAENRRSAGEWRQREQALLAEAAGLDSQAERADRLAKAAVIGQCADRREMAAEKWHLSALKHQQHLDSIQCLVGPRELHVVQGGVPPAVLSELGAAIRSAFVRAGMHDAASALDAALAELSASAEVVDAEGEPVDG